MWDNASVILAYLKDSKIKNVAPVSMRLTDMQL